MFKDVPVHVWLRMWIQHNVIPPHCSRGISDHLETNELCVTATNVCPPPPQMIWFISSWLFSVVFDKKHWARYAHKFWNALGGTNLIRCGNVRTGIFEKIRKSMSDKCHELCSCQWAQFRTATLMLVNHTLYYVLLKKKKTF